MLQSEKRSNQCICGCAFSNNSQSASVFCEFDSSALVFLIYLTEIMKTVVTSTHCVPTLLSVTGGGTSLLVRG